MSIPQVKGGAGSQSHDEEEETSPEFSPASPRNDNGNRPFGAALGLGSGDKRAIEEQLYTVKVSLGA